MENIVSVRHLSQCYGKHWAVDDLTFDIPAHGIVGLLGANGTGKSTTMNMICGVLSPTKGDVWICGINLKEQPEEARKYIGFLPQQPPLYADLTVEEYLTHCAHLHLMPPQKVPQAVRQVMEKCSIAHFAKRLIKSLSGGYQQRVGIAQAIVHGPRLVVLDEPTNGLDPNQIIDIRNLIREIARQHTVLLSTHILSEVEATCQEIRMINEGKLVFSGSMEDFDNFINPSGFQVEFAVPVSKEQIRAMFSSSFELEQESGTRFRIQTEQAVLLAQEFIVHCAAKGIKLHEVRVDRCELSEIFARLSGRQFRTSNENTDK